MNIGRFGLITLITQPNVNQPLIKHRFNDMKKQKINKAYFHIFPENKIFNICHKSTF